MAGYRYRASAIFMALSLCSWVQSRQPRSYEVEVFNFLGKQVPLTVEAYQWGVPLSPFFSEPIQPGLSMSRKVSLNLPHGPLLAVLHWHADGKDFSRNMRLIVGSNEKTPAGVQETGGLIRYCWHVTETESSIPEPDEEEKTLAGAFSDLSLGGNGEGRPRRNDRN